MKNILFIVFLIAFGCIPEKMDSRKASNSSLNKPIVLKKDLKINSLLAEFIEENSLDSTGEIVIVSHRSSRVDFIDYFDIEITSLSNCRLPFYPDSYCKIEGFLIFFFTEFNSWYSQEELELNFKNVIKEHNTNLSCDSLLVRTPTWKVELINDSIINVRK
ncbi:MAG: hypothetical protein ABJO02_15825 [Reichenbachiella sp.]|uniref:hypothetical protein n=1 Tax=Reichenbachiella sp. TaxID=2184521 RepID=UPI003299BBAA